MDIDHCCYQILFIIISILFIINSIRKKDFKIYFILSLVIGTIASAILPQTLGITNDKNKIFLAITFAGIYIVLATLISLITKAISDKKQIKEDNSQINLDEQLLERVEEVKLLENDEREMIRGVLSLNDLSARDLMIHRTNVEAIPITAQKEEILSLINETAYSRFPVYDGDFDKIIGILNSRRYLLNLLSNDQKPITELLYDARFEPESLHADKLLERMKHDHLQMVIIIDEYGGNAGIVTMENLLEELVGQIYDETDDPKDEEGEITQINEGVWSVSGDITLLEIENIVKIDFEEQYNLDPSDTIAALVFSNISEIPQDGIAFTIDCAGMHIEVDGLVERRILNVKISKLPVIQ